MIYQISASYIELSSGGEGALGAIDNVDPVLLEDRDKKICELLVCLHAKIFPVVPFSFLRIELGASFLNLVQGECADEFFHGEKLPVIARVPAEHGEHIHESLREISVLAVTP